MLDDSTRFDGKTEAAGYAPDTRNRDLQRAPAVPPPPPDEPALRDLEKIYRPLLLSFLKRLTRGDAQWAEDLVQETLLRAWRHPEARNGEGRWSRGWLFTVAKRIFIDQLRSAMARPDAVPDQYIEARADTDDPTERVLEALEVRAALDSLPERLRITLVEIYFRERSVAEVAETLDVPPGTVKSRTFYALRALREAMAVRGFVVRSGDSAVPADQPEKDARR